jgi:hypothetical protein
MPPALDRLAASPSARRLLRSFSTAPICRTARPGHPLKWRRWKQPEEKPELASRNKVLHSLLLATDANPVPNPDTSTTAASDAVPTLDDTGAAWAATLAYRERHDGQRGVEAVWSNICAEGYDLPVIDSPHAQALWGTFAKHPRLVPQVIDHAASILRDTNQKYPHLYQLIIGYWLPRDTVKALEYHHQLLLKLNLRSLPLRDLVRSKRSQFQLSTYESLLEIYNYSNEHNLYDVVVQSLIDAGHMIQARHWHRVCTSRGDLPSETMAAHPVVQLFVAGSLTSTNDPMPTFSHQSIREQSAIRYNKELMQRLLGRDTAPVRFEDSFCARMFATRAFSPDSIINGLAMAGINEIGPQALRAMALRIQPITELPVRLNHLRAAGITLRGSVFSLAMEKFSAEGKWDLVESMLMTDQHPEVFDDAELQRSLLEQYIRVGDSKQAQRTLAILTLFHNDPSHEAWNTLLQLTTTSSTPFQVMNVLNDMRLHGVMVSDESVIAITCLLRPRHIGRRPGVSRCGRFDDLRFVARAYMYILEAGMARLSPYIWREIIRRFGMFGRLRELRRLLLWLHGWYAPPLSVEFTNIPRSPFHISATERLRSKYPSRRHYFHFPPDVRQIESATHPVRQLLPPNAQQALIVWGFRAGLHPNATLEQSLLEGNAVKKAYRQRFVKRGILKRADWSIGLEILVQLRDLGLHVNMSTVIKALKMQFVVLFSRRPSRVKANQAVKLANRHPYSHFVHKVNAIWGSPLFVEPELFAQSGIHRQAWHPRKQRRVGEKPAEVSLKRVMHLAWRNNMATIDRPPRIGEGDRELDALERVYSAQQEALNQSNEGEFADAGVGVSGRSDGDAYGLVFKTEGDQSSVPPFPGLIEKGRGSESV